MKTKSANITRNAHLVTLDERIDRNRHLPGVIWFTGLPGSGKSTLTSRLEEALFDAGYQVSVVDNDVVRKGLSSDLAFSHDDRTENVRRAAEVAGLLARAGRLVLAGFISPCQSDRDRARQAVGEGFHEVFLDADADVCEQRDAENLYAKAKSGSIPEFTGVSAPYEKPLSPELVLDTVGETVDGTVNILSAYVEKHFHP